MAKPKAQYTEQDLHDAFICGVKHGQRHAEGDPEPKLGNWIDAMFLHGFQSDVLFDRADYRRKYGCWAAPPNSPKVELQRRIKKGLCPECGATYGLGYVCHNGHTIVSCGPNRGRKLVNNPKSLEPWAREMVAKAKAAKAGK
jgi:hypothetical protein